MAKGILIVLTDPLEGQDDAFNDWYDNVHVPEMLNVRGFAAVQRFEAVPWTKGEMPERKYVAVYEFDDEVENVKEAVRQFRYSAHANTDQPPVIDSSASLVYAFRAIGDRVEA